MINGIIVQNNPLKYIDPRGLQPENTPTYQEQTVGESVTRESYFVDEYDNKNYLDVGYDSGNNISLSSGYDEVPGLSNYGIFNPSKPVPITYFLSSESVKDQVVGSTSTNSLVGPISGGVGVAAGAAERAGKRLLASKIIQGIKATGYVAIGFNALNALSEGHAAYKEGKWLGVAKAGLDVTMAGVGVFPGIGFGASTAYYALDTLGYVDSAFDYIENTMSNPVRNSIGHNPISRHAIGRYSIGQN